MKITGALLPLAALLAAPLTTQAIPTIINGTFATDDLTGWTAFGDVSVVNNHGRILLDNALPYATLQTLTASFLDISELIPSGEGTPISGSALLQIVPGVFVPQDFAYGSTTVVVGSGPTEPEFRSIVVPTPGGGNTTIGWLLFDFQAPDQYRGFDVTVGPDTSSVPDGGTTAVSLAGGLLGLVLLRRRLHKPKGK